MRKIWIVCFFTTLIIVSCSESKKDKEAALENNNSTSGQTSQREQDNGSPDIKKGLSLIKGSDCIACHMENQKLVGPSYKDVALKYRNDENAREQLIKNITEGASGVWGEVAMPAHPQLSKEQVSQMVDYILAIE